MYRGDMFELRQGDRIRLTMNDAVHGLVNSQTAEIDGKLKERPLLSFKLEHGRMASTSRRTDPQIAVHSTAHGHQAAHAFQGRTVDTVIAAMEVNHPHLTIQKTLYVHFLPCAGPGGNS